MGHTGGLSPEGALAESQTQEAYATAGDNPPAARAAGSFGIVFWLVLACLPITLGLVLSTPHVPESFHDVTVGFGDATRELAADVLTWLGRRAP